MLRVDLNTALIITYKMQFYYIWYMFFGFYTYVLIDL